MDKQNNVKLLDEFEKMRREKAKVDEQLAKLQAKVGDSAKVEQEWKARAGKAEQCLEKSLKGLKDKLKQQENVVRIKDAELEECRVKIGVLETNRNQDLAMIGRIKGKVGEKELEGKLAEKEHEVR